VDAVTGFVALRYEPVAMARFEVERTPEAEQVRIKARTGICPVVSPSMANLMDGRRRGGHRAVRNPFQLFLAVWLCARVAGWIVAAGTLAGLFMIR
jgi:hypothetical protein